MNHNLTPDILQIDREDLLAVIAMRFGEVPEAVRARINACNDGATLERWILVAANAPSWEVLIDELMAGQAAFRLVGQRYQPAATGGSLTAASRRDSPGED